MKPWRYDREGLTQCVLALFLKDYKNVKNLNRFTDSDFFVSALFLKRKKVQVVRK